MADKENILCRDCGKCRAEAYAHRCKECHDKFLANKRKNYKSSADLEEHRRKCRENANKWYKKHCAEDPSWNARKQREYRVKYPMVFNRCLGRYYLRKLSKDEFKKLVEQVSLEKELIVVFTEMSV